MRFRWESCKGDYALSRITGSHFSFQFFAGFPECRQALVAVLIILFTLQFAKLQREKDERLARHGAENCRRLRRCTSEILGTCPVEHSESSLMRASDQSCQEVEMPCSPYR